MPDTVFAPEVVSLEDQFHIGRSLTRVSPPGPQLSKQLAATVDARVRRNSDLTIRATRLSFSHRLGGCAQQGATQAHVTIDPDVLSIGASVGHEGRHPLQQLPIDGSAVQVDDADDTAHWAFTSTGRMARSKGAK